VAETHAPRFHTCEEQRAALVKALSVLESANEAVSRARSEETYMSILVNDRNGASALFALDAARRKARSVLKSTWSDER